MTAQKSTRKRLSSLLATATAALLAAGGLALAPTAAMADEPAATPTITLSKNTLNPNGDVLTVTGSGFDASFKGLAPYYGCADPDNASKGFYVQAGWIKDTWRPSQGGANNVDRKGGPNTWFADDTNCQAPSRWVIADNGTASFTYTLQLTQADLGELPEGARYAVFTSGAGGGTQAVNELSADLSFSTADPAPSVAASVADAVRGKLDVKFDLSNIASPTGAYVSVIEAGTAGELSQTNLGIASDWITPGDFANGAASRTLSIEASKLDRNKSYSIVAWQAHTFPTAGAVYALDVPLTVTPEQWDTVFTPADPTTTTLAAAASSVKWDEKAQLTATVTPATAAGKVQFAANGNALGKPVAVNGGTAKLTTELPAGQNSVTAKFVPTNAYDYVASEAAPVAITVTGAKPLPFTDVKKGQKFYTEINWLYQEGVATGIKQANGTYKFEPKWNITREATAAYLYRLAGKPAWSAPKVSPFADLKPTDKFYKEITWLADQGITTGVAQPSGKPRFEPKWNITREAMSAFVYRFEGKPKFTAPGTSPFADLKRGDKFYKEITWAADAGVTTGIKQPTGKAKYEPKWNITREAMAAFLYRLDAK